MRPRRNFLVCIGSFLLATLLVGALVLWKMGFFTERLDAFTEKELAAAAAKRNGQAPIMRSGPERIEPGRRVRLAIGSVGLPTEQQSREVSDLVLADLTDAKGLEMIERQALDKVLS